MMDEEQQAMALYEAPFHHERGYIWDAKNKMVADDGAVLRVRGWGRISYLPDAEKLQDAVGDLIAKALTEYWQVHNARLTGAEPAGGASELKR